MGFWSRIRRVIRPGSCEDEIREELDFHLEMDRMNGHDAREARLRLGNRTRIQEEVRDVRIATWLESVSQDIRYGLRQSRKNPALSFAIVVSLAVGLGANTAIFNLMDAALLEPLPVHDPDQLVLLEWIMDGQPRFAGRISGAPRMVEGGMQIPSVSEAVHRGFADQQSWFASVFGFSRRIPMAVSDANGVNEVGVQYVSANFFSGLGVRPIVGRSFLEEEDRRGQDPPVILSHRYWIGRLGGEPDVLGSRVRVNDAPARVVGVAPPGFFGMTIGEWVDVYAPLSARPAFEPGVIARPPSGGENADWWVLQAARLEPEVVSSVAAAQATGLFRGLTAETTGTEPEMGLGLVAEPGRRGRESIGGGEREARSLWILMLLVSGLWIIVCVNVANLLLSRSVSQQREAVVRLALGAPRRRLFRQHLIGSGILAVLGGISGLGLGYLMAQGIHALFQTGRGTGNVFDLELDWRMLSYAAVLSGVTALVFGLAPALRAARSELDYGLRIQPRSVVDGWLRLPRLLVSTEIALTFAAIVAAGLLGRSLENLNTISLGFDAENLAYATVNPYQAGYTQDRVGPYLDRLTQGLEAVPGVVGVGVLDARPLEGGGRGTWASTPEGPPARLEDGRPNPAAEVNLSLGGSGLMDTLRVQVLAGRPLEAGDTPQGGVAVVDERFSEVFFSGRNPVGERFEMFGQSIEVVGLAANARFLNLRDEETPTVYMPFDPTQFLPGETHIAVRAAVGSGQLAAEVRRVVAALDPAVPVTEFHTQTGLIDRFLRTERLLAFVSGGFGVIALILAAIGLGGLLAYAVARRTNEIGLRMALGASPADVIRMILRDSMWVVGLGVLVGIPLAYAVARFLEASLYALEPVDPASAGLALALLLLVALTAALLPARRAARVDPMTALREE